MHQLTYIAIFLLPWHILDKMGMHWTRLTPIEVLITIVTLILFIQRKILSKLIQFADKKLKKLSKFRDYFIRKRGKLALVFGSE